MGDQKISGMTPAIALGATDILPIIQSATNKTITAALLSDYATASLGAYGVRWYTTASASAVTRIGNTTNHIMLPVQSLMRRCLLSDDGATVTYLMATDSTKDLAGNAIALDGSAGQVMVEIPDFWYKSWSDGNYKNLLISHVDINGYTKISKHYVGAFKASLQRSTSKLASVINLTTDYRGGANQAAWDAAANTMLGHPVSSLSLTNFRTYARNRNARYQAMPFLAHNAINMLYLVEYANRNSQLSVNAALTAEGYKQGGLGNGVTTVNGTNLNTFNGFNPLIPVGKSVTLGNSSGEVNYVVAGFTAGDITVTVNSYRGIENIFGDIWEWSDGVLFNLQSAGAGGRSFVHICDLPANYADTITANYRAVGDLGRSDGWITDIIGGAECIMLPSATGGGSTTYFTDYGYVADYPGSGSDTTGLFISSIANNGTDAGLWSMNAYHAPSIAYANVGSRLCFF